MQANPYIRATLRLEMRCIRVTNGAMIYDTGSDQWPWSAFTDPAFSALNTPCAFALAAVPILVNLNG
jgi:hypothetical protein